MKIPLSYSFRSLWTRKLTTFLTIAGVALVAFVFTAVLMLANGVKDTLVATGADDNAIVLRKSAESETLSIITFDEAAVIGTQPEIALGKDGQPMMTKEVLTIINCRKHGAGPSDLSNVTVRGVTPDGLILRPQVKLTEGRMFNFGASELIIGTQTWMAQNLNYNAPGSMCYDNDPRNGAFLGRLYPWYVAMGGAPSDSSNPGKVQGVCPKGWHVPSLSEWNQLFTATGGITSFSKSGNALESPFRDTSAGGWLPSTINFTPSNSSGFSALPGGGFFWDTTSPPLGTPTFHFVGKSQQGFFLTSTLVPAGQVWAGRVNAITFGINGTVSVIQRQGNPDDPIDPYQPSMNASCRCVKDP